MDEKRLLLGHIPFPDAGPSPCGCGIDTPMGRHMRRVDYIMRSAMTLFHKIIIEFPGFVKYYRSINISATGARDPDGVCAG